jgi:hypothetical protein
MKHSLVCAGWLLICSLVSCAQLQRVEPAGPPRVLLLGDSISIGYTPFVRELLGGQAVVVRPMSDDGARAENCAGTTKGMEHVERWLKASGGDFDVIHFNFGLHDLKRVKASSGANSDDKDDPQQAGLETYTDQLRSITLTLLSSGAQLCFATTTPVPGGGVRPHRDPQDVIEYNAAAVQLMQGLGVTVNDLYTSAQALPAGSQLPVNVHFSKAGSRELAGGVASAILDMITD